MIRFLDLTNQINDEQFSFSFYNTCTNKIESFAGEQVFDSKEDFIEAYNIASSSSKKLHELKRYLSLIPSNFCYPSYFSCFEFEKIKEHKKKYQIITNFKEASVSVGLDYKNCFHEVK
ncbi:hypothetical protein LNJ03_11275 [Tenacibaculum dicentrarchi]|nr:hypothetical protein [Tenacibaculum dicentrarchi]